MDYRELVINLPAASFWVPLVLLTTAAAFAFLFGLRWLQRAVVIANTPTSLLRSAAQGFAEFEGRGQLLPGPPIVAPLTGSVCLWYRVKVVERSEGDRRRWDVVTDECSDALFLLRDHTGECVVDPEGAVITPNTTLTWYSDSLLTGTPPALGSGWLAAGGRYRFTEERLEVGTRLYVMGWFSTHGGSQEVPDTPAEVRSLLNQWKRDYATLLRRFDADGNGALDEQEWETTRKAAAVEVRRQQRERFGSGTVNLISRPADGRTFVISSESQEVLVRRWRRFALFAFGGFVVTGSVALWAALTRLHVL